jgi:protein-S-isoprenylcysteine O-methyltransferase Ste14
MLLRHLLSILLLPFVVVVVVPRSLLRASAPAGGPADHAIRLWPNAVVGVALFAAGFLLFAWCVTLFVRVGRGTLAPWDPTRSLVAVGPYRHIRNPMITGVTSMLLGEAVFWNSGVLALWAASFLLINHLYFVVLEEPGLERRFGRAYQAYRAEVPRWLPRLRPRRR